MTDNQFYFLVYLGFVLLFMFVDALVTINVKKRYRFFSSFIMSAVFPVSVLFLIVMAEEMTKEFGDED